MKKAIPILLLLFACGKIAAQQTVGLFQYDSLAAEGYTLFSPISNKNTYLIDNCGELAHSWESQLNPGLSAYLLPDGRLLRAGRIPSNFNGGGSGGQLQIFSWDGALLWNYPYSSPTFHQHHDVEMLPNGNVLVIAWELHSVAEAVAQGRMPGTLPPGGIWSEQVVELLPIGPDSAAVVWEWHLWDHLVQDADTAKPNFGPIAEHPELADLNYDPFGTNQGTYSDWVHLNSIDYHAGRDEILLSSRHFSEAWVIDHSTTSAEAASHTGGNSGRGGDLLYRFGNPSAYQRGTLADQAYFGQHDAQWIPEGQLGEGQILVFNNGVGRPDGIYSTVEAIQPPLDTVGHYFLENGEAYGPGFFSWEYLADPPGSLFSSNISGAQRLPNGNTLICEGQNGDFREVTFGGNIVWRYVNPVGPFGPAVQGQMPASNNVFRATRYPADFPAFAGRDLTPQGPLELEPGPPLCMTTAAGAGLRPVPGLAVSLSQNPISEFLMLENKNGRPVNVQVFDAVGRPVFSGKFAEQKISVEAGRWPAGLYFVRVSDADRASFWACKFLKN